MPLRATSSHNFCLVALSKWHSTLLESSPLNSKWRTGHKFSLEEVLESLNSSNFKSSTADNSRQVFFLVVALLLWMCPGTGCIKTLPARVLVACSRWRMSLSLKLEGGTSTSHAEWKPLQWTNQTNKYSMDGRRKIWKEPRPES